MEKLMMSNLIKTLSVSLLLTFIIPVHGMFRTGLFAARTAATRMMAKPANYQKYFTSFLKSPYARSGAVVLAAGSTYFAKYREESTQNFPKFRKGKAPQFRDGKVWVYNLAGDIDIQGWDKETLSLTTVKEANNDEAMKNTEAKTKIDTLTKVDWGMGLSAWNPPTSIPDTESSRLICTTVDPSQTFDGGYYYSQEQLQKKYSNVEGIPHFHNKPIAKTHYKILTPRNASIEARNMEGTIRIKDISGSVEARSKMGNIFTENCSSVNATTINGNVDIRGAQGGSAESTYGNVSFSRSGSQGINIQAKTVSGNVTAENCSGSVLAKSVSGDVTVTGLNKELMNVEAYSMIGNVTVANAKSARVSSKTGNVKFHDVESANEVYCSWRDLSWY